MKFKILNIYKPAGLGSFDVVRRFKWHLGKEYKKIGHFGTLDPFAEGLLLLGLGKASKLNDYVHELLSKTYVAHGIFGIETETGDMTVEPIRREEESTLREKFSNLSSQEIEEKLRAKFLGQYLQAPHAYSASKFEGKKLHEWAREGVLIEKEKVKRFVHSIRVLEFDFPKIKLKFEVSSGTYIRTLFNDCAKFLGTFGTLESLIRTQVGAINLHNSLREQDWPSREDKNPQWQNDNAQVSIDELFDLERGIANDFQIKLLNYGQKLDLSKHNQIFKNEMSIKDQFVFIYDEQESLHSFSKIESNTLKVIVNLKQ